MAKRASPPGSAPPAPRPSMSASAAARKGALAGCSGTARTCAWPTTSAGRRHARGPTAASTGVYVIDPAELGGSGSISARLWFSRPRALREPSKAGAPPAAPAVLCTVTRSRCCPGSPPTIGPPPPRGGPRGGGPPPPPPPVVAWNREVGAGRGGSATAKWPHLQAAGGKCSRRGTTLWFPRYPQHRQWRSLSGLWALLARLAATAGGEGRPPHSPPPRRPSGLQGSGRRLRPGAGRASCPGRAARALEDLAPGCSLAARRNLAPQPGLRRPPEEQAGGLFSHAPCAQLRLRPGTCRRSGNLRAHRPPAIRQPSVPPRQAWAAAKAMRPAAGKRSSTRRSTVFWERSWPGASSTSSALFHFPALADGAYRAQWRQFPGERSCRFGRCEASTGGA